MGFVEGAGDLTIWLDRILESDKQLSGCNFGRALRTARRKQKGGWKMSCDLTTYQKLDDLLKRVAALEELIKRLAAEN